MGLDKTTFSVPQTYRKNSLQLIEIFYPKLMECFLSGNEINVVNEELDGFDAHTSGKLYQSNIFYSFLVFFGISIRMFL